MSILSVLGFKRLMSTFSFTATLSHKDEVILAKKKRDNKLHHPVRPSKNSLTCLFKGKGFLKLDRLYHLNNIAGTHKDIPNTEAS